MANRHKRDTDARRIPRAALLAAPLAVLATGAAVTVGVLGHDPAPAVIAQEATTTGFSRDADSVSRSASRTDAALATASVGRFLVRVGEANDARDARRAGG